MNSKTLAPVLALVTLGATAFATSTLLSAATTSTSAAIARPNPHLAAISLNYGGSLTQSDGKPTVIRPLISGVVDAALTDERYLQYERGSDLGDFEPAPVGNLIVITTTHASQSSAVKAQLPLYATAGHNQINAFAYVPGSSTGGSSSSPGSDNTGSDSTGSGSNGGRSGSKINGGGAGSAGSTGSNNSGSGNTGSRTTGGSSSTGGSSTTGSSTGTTAPKSTGGGKTNTSGTTTSTTSTNGSGATGSTTTTTTPGPHRSAPTATSSPATGTGTSTSTTLSKSAPTSTVPTSTTTTTTPTTSTTIPSQAIGMTNDHNGEAVITATNMAPGETASELVTIGNDGTIPFQLSVQGTNATANSLGAALTLTITRVSDGQLIYQGALESPVVSVEEMAVNEATQFRVSLELSSAAGNSYQNQSAKVDLIWSGQG